MDESKELVLVSLDEYAELYEDAVNFSILKRLMLETATLSYNKKYLNYDDEIISAILKIMNRDGYESRLKELIEDHEQRWLKEESDGTDHNV